MGLFTRKDPCAICGGKVSGLFVSKVEGQLICKECYGNVDLPQEAMPLTMDTFLAYRQFREENQQLKNTFQTTEKIDFGFFGADFVFDRNHRLFSLSPTLDRTIFPGSAIKSFVISEDGQPLFECSAQGFLRYESDVPARVWNLAPQIEQYRMQVEMQRNLERMAEEQRRRDPNAPPPPPSSTPSIDLPEPFERFYVNITLEHPYWPTIHAEKKGPTFSSFTPDVNDYLREYTEGTARMERLALALKEVAFPSTPEQFIPLGGVCQPAAPAAAPVDTVEELRRYKELLDQGILTQEEFAAKKRQLLGI